MKIESCQIQRQNLLPSTILCTALLWVSLALPGYAVNKYWDTDGPTPGAGGPTPSGTWSTGVANWSLDPTGSSATVVWTNGTADMAIFSAGTDATGEFTVNVPSAIAAGALTVKGGIVDLTGTALTVRNITITNGATLSYVASGAIVAGAGSGTGTTNLTLNNGTFRCTTPGNAGTFLTTTMGIILGALGGTLSYDNPTTPANLSIYSGVISGTGNLIKEGTAVLALAGASTYSGSTTINNGVLRIRTTSNRLPTGTAVIINSPGVFDPGSTAGNIQQVSSVNGDGNITFSAASYLAIAGSAASTISGVIGPATGARIYKTGTGTLTLNGNNIYTGRMDISGTGAVTVNEGASLCGPVGDVYANNGGTLNLNNTAQTVENLVSTNSTGIINLNGSGSGHTLTLQLGFSSIYSGTIAGVGAVVVTGGIYTQTLSGNNTYSGGTTLNSGALVLSGNNNAGSGGFTVHSGILTLSGINTGTGTTTVHNGTLIMSGTNTSAGATTVNAGKLLGISGGSMANSVVTVEAYAANGVLVTDNTRPWTCGGLSTVAGSSLDFDFGATPTLSSTVAPLQVNGNVDFSLGAPTVTLAVSNCPAGPAKYPLVTWTGTLSGTPPAGGLLGPHGEWNLVVEGNTLYLSITNNSQPLTWAASSQNWDTTSGNWVNAAMTRVSYQDSPAPGDWVVFEDTQSGSSPINVTMVTDVNPYGVIFSNTAKEYTLAGYSGIAGSTSLTKRGTNKLTLINGYNSYTGPTLVQQGTLQLGDGVLNGQVASVISVSNSASLVFSNATDQTHPPDIRGAGTLIKGAAGTLTLGASAGNDISGGQNVYDGTLLLNNTANTMSGAILVNGPSAKLKLASSGCIGSTAVGSGDVTLNNGATFQNDAGVAFTYLTANRKIIIGANGGRFTTADGSTPLTAVLLYSGQIAGATPGIGVLTYDGPGEFRTYSSHNTFGKLIVNGGRFTAGQSTSPAYNDSYGQIPAVLTPDAITIQNGSELRRAGGVSVTLDVKQGIFMGPGGGTIRVFDGSTGGNGLFAIPGPITGSGPLTLGTSADYWTNQLSGNNTFSGGVTLQNGTICVNSATALGAASSTITINPISLKPIIRNTSGGPITLANNNPQTWMGDFTFNGTSDLNLGTGAVTLSPVSGTAINVTNLANVLTVGGVISGSGMGLAKYGTATLMLTALNDYSGDTTISAGTLQLGDGTAKNGNVAGNLVDNATLVFSNPTALTYSAGVISGTGTVIKRAAGTLTLSNGPETYSGVTSIEAGTLQVGTDDVLSDVSPVTLPAGTTLDMNNKKDTIAALSGPGSVINNTSTTLTLGGDANTGAVFQNYSCIYAVITNGSLAKDGTHAMALRETNGLTVPVTLKKGTLSVGIRPNQMLAATELDVPLEATFQLDANHQAVASLSGSGKLNLGGGTLTVNQTNDTTFSGVIQNSDVAGSSTAVGHGLRGYYYDNIDFTSLLAVRDDASVNFTNLSVINDTNGLPSVFTSTNDFSIRWLGQVQSTVAGDYKFTSATDDGARLWVNGVLVVDSWVLQSPTPRSGMVTLAANTRYDVVFEYFNRSGGAQAILQWLPPGGDTTTNAIPSDNLFLPGPGKLAKSGSGKLTLAGANTYSGGTEVNAGSLDAQAAMGVGNVSVASGATVILSTTAAIASTGDLLLSGATPVVNLNLGGGTVSIHGLSYDGGATYQPAGQYGPSGSGATYENSRFTGSGFVAVGAGPVSANTVVSSFNPATYGSSITFTSTVTGPGGTPTGSVTFYDGASAIGTAALDGSGVATLSVSKLTVAGSVHPITAVYNGDASYTPNTSSAVAQTINPATLVPSVTVTNRVYDGTASGTISSRSLAGVISGDAPYVSLAGGTATFLDKNVGTNKTVNAAGLSLTGSLSGNYVLSTSSASATATITNRLLTVTAATSTKPYDGNTNSVGVPTITTGTLATGDTAVWTQTFDSPEVGARTLKPAGTVDDSNSGRNYAVTYATAIGSITPACSSVNALLGIIANTNGTFTMAFQGASHAQYYVKTHTNLTAPMADWVAVAGSTNLVTNGSGLWSFTVTNTAPTRFYRSTAMSVCP